ncbi:MAG: DNA recombination protein RmuC [Candidatus Gastranaerophilales bacterium]|nr:DNA recombination protein RmuC [Candidatus Gastranaerophilales bacterium]
MIYFISSVCLVIGLILGFLFGKNSNNNEKFEIVKLQEQLKTSNENLKNFADLEKLVTEQFTNIANKTILDKQNNLSEQNSKLLEPLSKNLELFKTRLEELTKEGSKNTETIKTQIETLLSENKIIKNTANELTKALKENSQARGELGEIILENILKASGLKNKNEYGEMGNYITQTGFRDLNNPSSPLIRPDAVIFFPDNKNIIVDSKLALNDFKEFANCDNEEDKQKYLKSFYNQVESMAEELGGKYNNLDGLNTPDFKLMFIPFEGILSYIMDNQKLIEFATTKNVVIVGPSTLIATLKIISYCWAQKNQAENIKQILKIGESMYSKCNILIEKIEILKNRFLSVEGYFDEVMKPISGKGGLTSLVDKFVDFGLNPSKKINEKYLPENEEETVLAE